MKHQWQFVAAENASCDDEWQLLETEFTVQVCEGGFFTVMQYREAAQTLQDHGEFKLLAPAMRRAEELSTEREILPPVKALR